MYATVQTEFDLVITMADEISVHNACREQGDLTFFPNDSAALSPRPFTTSL
jgi:hypothetical protein